jgi:CheY-like chemotaxis protein
MSKTGPIIVIDDDPDDQEMIQRVISKLNPANEIKRFFDGEEALQYFKETTDKPFLIICDINMPLMNGLELKKNIEASPVLSKKVKPFVYLTTTAQPDQLLRAYDLTCHGFFIKGQSYTELKETLIQIIAYWNRCEHPR